MVWVTALNQRTFSESMLTRSNSSTVPRPRTLIHPGPFNPVRIQTLRATSARRFRLALPARTTLFDAIVTTLATEAVENASLTVLGGSFTQLHYCVAPPDPSGRAIIAYTKPIDAGAAYMVFGSATLGKSISGAPLIHCHATFRTAVGDIKGGHILTESCIIGCNPICALVVALDGLELRQTFDPETNIPLLQPQRKHNQ